MPSFDAADKYFVSTKPSFLMKKAILILGVAVCSVAVFTNLCAKSIHPVVAMWESAAFNWAQTLFDFGSIKHNVPVTHTFKFTNKGDGPLIITSVQASCGCTVTEYSKDPVAPGADGFVKATYNAAKLGVFNKTVTVNANTEGEAVLLSIKGTVVE
jgi:hypothetical protein